MKKEITIDMFDGVRRYHEIARICGTSWQSVQGFARRNNCTYAHFENGVLKEPVPVYQGLRDVEIKIDVDNSFFNNPFRI